MTRKPQLPTDVVRTVSIQGAGHTLDGTPFKPSTLGRPSRDVRGAGATGAGNGRAPGDRTWTRTGTAGALREPSPAGRSKLENRWTTAGPGQIGRDGPRPTPMAVLPSPAPCLAPRSTRRTARRWTTAGRPGPVPLP